MIFGSLGERGMRDVATTSTSYLRLPRRNGSGHLLHSCKRPPVPWSVGRGIGGCDSRSWRGSTGPFRGTMALLIRRKVLRTEADVPCDRSDVGGVLARWLARDATVCATWAYGVPRRSDGARHAS